MNTRRTQEIGTRAEIWRLWQKAKKAIQKNRVPCQPSCKSSFPTERDIQWFLNATQAMIKNIDKEAAERRIQIWSDRMKRFLNRKTKAASASGTLELHQRRKIFSDLSRLIPNRQEQTGGVESTQKKYAVRRRNQLSFRDDVDVQQCEIPDLSGKDLRREAKGLSSMRSVAMCGWRSQETTALPEEMFDLFAILLKQSRETINDQKFRFRAVEENQCLGALSLWTGPSSSTALKETWSTVWFR